MPDSQKLMAEFVATRHSLYAFIFGWIRHAHDAEDLFQEVWLRFSKAVADGVDEGLEVFAGTASGVGQCDGDNDAGREGEDEREHFAL